MLSTYYVLAFKNSTVEAFRAQKDNLWFKLLTYHVQESEAEEGC